MAIMNKSSSQTKEKCWPGVTTNVEQQQIKPSSYSQGVSKLANE